MTRVLALDVGTSSVRARLYDEPGLHVEGSEARRTYEAVGGRLDCERLAEACEAVYGEVLDRAGGDVAAVGVSCFWHSLVPMDDRGTPLGEVLTWRDTRAAAAAASLRDALDEDAVHARTGCPLHASFWPAKLAWLAAEEPETWRRAARFLSFSDYLVLRLRGDGRTSLSMASGTGLLDLNLGKWDEDLLGELGVEPHRLPEISDEAAGDGPPWFPVLGDGACSNVGVGCTTRDRAALMVGTSGAFRTVFGAERAEPRPGLFCYRLDGRRFVEGGSLSDGGNLYAWLDRTLKLGADAKRAALREPDGHGLTFLTLLGGERSPGWRAGRHGALNGLSFDTTPDDILQAGLEGVAFRFAEVVELMPEVREIVGTGGALLADPGWLQIVADVLGRPVVASTIAEGSARGVAVVALERLGVTPAPAPLGRTYEPRADRHEVYLAARERQRELYRELT